MTTFSLECLHNSSLAQKRKGYSQNDLLCIYRTKQGYCEIRSQHSSENYLKVMTQVFIEVYAEFYFLGTCNFLKFPSCFIDGAYCCTVRAKLMSLLIPKLKLTGGMSFDVKP